MPIERWESELSKVLNAEQMDARWFSHLLAENGYSGAEVRTVTGWRRLLITFTWQHLSADDLEAWSTLDDLFRNRAA